MKTQTPTLRALARSLLRLPLIAIGLLLAPDAALAQGGDDFASPRAFNYPFPVLFGGFSNTTATAEPGERRHGPSNGPAAFHSVWFKLTVPRTGYISLNTTGSNFDTVLSVYTGTQVKALTRVAADDDSGDGSTSKVTFLAKVGTAYLVAVDGFNLGSMGTYNLAVGSFVPLQAKTWTDVVLISNLQSSALITLNTTTTGAVSGTLKMGARSHPFATHMSATGRILTYISRASSPGQPPALLDVTQDTAGLVLAGTLDADSEEGDDANSIFPLSLRSANVFTAASPCPRKGVYTFITSAAGGIGHSFGTLKVGNLGAITVAGFMGDGSTLTLSGPELNNSVATSGLFRARAVYGTTGQVTVSFILSSAASPATLGGSVAFRRGIKPGAVFLPEGATLSASITASAYTPPPPNTRMNAGFDATLGKGTLTATSSSGTITQVATLSTTNTFSYAAPNTPKLMLTVNKASGQISGTAIIGGKSCMLKGVSIDTPGTKGFFGFTAGMTFNGAMFMTPTP